MSTTLLVDASQEQLREILLKLFVEYAYKTGDFILSSGARSSFYINSKLVTLRADGALAVGRLLSSYLPPDTVAVGGLTLGGDPLVSAVSIVSALNNKSISALIVRKEAKGHGTNAYIEGPSLPAGSSVVVLEDVVTTGKSAYLAVERLRHAGYRVEQIISLIDRNEGGAQFYQEKGLKFKSVFSIEDLQRADLLKDSGSQS